MDLYIKKMEKRHWNDVSRIYKEGIDTNMATFQTDVPSYEEWDKSHLKNFRYVIEDGERILGWAVLSPVSSRCVYDGVAELSVYIDKNMRSKGLAKQLLEKMFDETDKNDIWTIQSSIMQDNIASIKLHKKCGFREVGYREKIARDKNGNWRNTVLMERRNKIV